LDVVDREMGLDKLYKAGLALPEDVCFEWGQKVAEDIVGSYVKLTTGNAWPVEVLQRLPLSKIAGVLGDDFVKAVASDDGMGVDFNKFAEIVPTLPRADASLLELALNAAKEASDKSTGHEMGFTNSGWSKAELTDHFKSLGCRVDDESDFRLAIKPNIPQRAQ
jgi:hypothetical protein